MELCRACVVLGADGTVDYVQIAPRHVAARRLRRRPRAPAARRRRRIAQRGGRPLHDPGARAARDRLRALAPRALARRDRRGGHRGLDGDGRVGRVPAAPAQVTVAHVANLAAAMEKHVEQFLEALAARGASRATVRAYRADLGAYTAWLAARDLRPEDATRADLRAYAASLGARGLAPSSRARALSAVRALHRRLLDTGRRRHRSGRRPARPPPPAAPADGRPRAGRRPPARRHVGRRAARPARPRPARAALRLRAARGGGLRARPRRRLAARAAG